ncbi:hypothetical protein ACM66B_003386 [Microbotryomycetes sp. NB124-2]
MQHHHPLDPHHPPSQQYGQYNQSPAYAYSFAQQQQQQPHYARQPYGMPSQGPPQYVYGRPPPQSQQQQQSHSANGSPAPQYATAASQQAYNASQPHSPVGPYHHHHPHHPALQPTNGPSSYNSRYTSYDARQPPSAQLGAADIGTSTINDLIGAAQPNPMQLPSLGAYGRADVALGAPQAPSSASGVMVAHSNGGTSGNVTDDEGRHDWPKSTTAATLPPASGKAKKQKQSGAGKAPAEKKFVCPHASCGRAFARNFNLQSHIKSHMGVRDYACPECNKKFSRKHDCTRHCVAIHKYDKETGKKAAKGGKVSGPPPDTEFVDNPPPAQTYTHMPLPPNTLHG